MEQRFRIQQVGTVAWSAAERAYKAYSRYYGYEQSLQRLHERGGFGLEEFASLYFGGDGRLLSREWRVVMVCQDPAVDMQVSEGAKDMEAKYEDDRRRIGIHSPGGGKDGPVSQ